MDRPKILHALLMERLAVPVVVSATKFGVSTRPLLIEVTPVMAVLIVLLPITLSRDLIVVLAVSRRKLPPTVDTHLPVVLVFRAPHRQPHAFCRILATR